MTRYKSCSHDMLNRINNKEVKINSEIEAKKATETIPNDVDSKSSSLYNLKNNQLSKNSTSTGSSLTRLYDTRIIDNNQKPSSKEDNFLSVESLFRDLMLDCDEEIKKIDEMEKLKKLQKIQQQEILKCIEINNLIAIYEIKKRKVKRNKCKVEISYKMKFRLASNVDIKKKMLKKIYGKKLIRNCFEFSYEKMKKLLIIKKMNKSSHLNPVVSMYRQKFINICKFKKPFFHIISLILNSCYLDYSLSICLLNFKLYSSKRELIQERRKQQQMIQIKARPKDKCLRKADTSGKIEANVHKSLLDEYYEKYCESSKNGSKKSKSVKQRSRTEERLNETSRDQVKLFFLLLSWFYF